MRAREAEKVRCADRSSTRNDLGARLIIRESKVDVTDRRALSSRTTAQIASSKVGHVSGEETQETQKDVIKVVQKRAFRVAGSFALF